MPTITAMAPTSATTVGTTRATPIEARAIAEKIGFRTTLNGPAMMRSVRSASSTPIRQERPIASCDQVARAKLITTEASPRTRIADGTTSSWSDHPSNARAGAPIHAADPKVIRPDDSRAAAGNDDDSRKPVSPVRRHCKAMRPTRVIETNATSSTKTAAVIDRSWCRTRWRCSSSARVPGCCAMGSATNEIDIDRPADDVWKVVRDFGGLAAWMPGIDSCRVEGDDRILEMMGMELTERLLRLDDDARTLAYGITNSPMPIEHHEATIRVTAVDDRTSHVTYT